MEAKTLGGDYIGKTQAMVPSYEQDGKLQVELEMRDKKVSAETYNYQSYINTCPAITKRY